MLKQIVYISTARSEFTEEALLELLERARRKNHALGVSGILLFDGSAFLQVLEGPNEAVDEVMAAIVRDPRHVGVTTVQDVAIEQRDFREWSMAFRKLDAEEMTRIQGLRDRTREAVKAIARELAQPVARVFVRQFAESGYRW